MKQIYPNKCCNCGLCCLSELCPVAMKEFSKKRHEVPCYAQSFIDGKSSCGLFSNSLYSQEILGIGAGCCIKARVVSKNGEEVQYSTLPDHIKFEVVSNILSKNIKL